MCSIVCYLHTKISDSYFFYFYFFKNILTNGCEFFHTLPLAKTLKPNFTALNERDNNLTDTLLQLNRLTADTQANARKVLFFAHAHFLFFNLADAHLAHLLLPAITQKPTHWTKAKEPNFANAPKN